MIELLNISVSVISLLSLVFGWLFVTLLISNALSSRTRLELGLIIIIMINYLTILIYEVI